MLRFQSRALLSLPVCGEPGVAEASVACSQGSGQKEVGAHPTVVGSRQGSVSPEFRLFNPTAPGLNRRKEGDTF